VLVSRRDIDDNSVCRLERDAGRKHESGPTCGIAGVAIGPGTNLRTTVKPSAQRSAIEPVIRPVGTVTVRVLLSIQESPGRAGRVQSLSQAGTLNPSLSGPAHRRHLAAYAETLRIDASDP
jgi:hypothetical protein